MTCTFQYCYYIRVSLRPTTLKSMTAINKGFYIQTYNIKVNTAI